MNGKIFALLSCILAITFWARPSHAAESYDNCTGFIDSIPAVVSTQGTWCLRKDLSTSMTSGAAITIATNNVTIDCNDFKLGGLSAGQSTMAFGIRADERSNNTIRNCSIRGFLYAISLEDFGNVVENNRLDGNTWVGIGIGGDGSIVRNNRVSYTGGTTATFSNQVKAVGIYAYGNVEIYDNLVTGVLANVGSNGYAIGINPGNNLTGAIYDNHVNNIVADGTGWAYGISFFSPMGHVTVQGNNITGPGTDAGYVNSVGVWCPSANHAVVRNNVVNGFGLLEYGCAYVAADNFFAPN